MNPSCAIFHGNQNLINKYVKDVYNFQQLQINKMENDIKDLQSQLKNLHEENIHLKSNKRKLTEDEYNVADLLVSNMNIVKKPKPNDALISRLIIAKKLSKVWTPEMSKYIGIFSFGTTNKWKIKSVVIDEPTLFDSREEAEEYYKKVILSKNIDLNLIIRKKCKM